MALVNHLCRLFPRFHDLPSVETLRVGDLEIDMRLREVRRGATVVRLQEQPFQILDLLLEKPGDVVSRERIRERLWSDGTTVDFEHSVNAAIKRLRTALGDDATQPRYVETVPRWGYRFIALPEAAARADESPTPSARPRLIVLPFVAPNGSHLDEAFGDGLTQELIAQLAHRCADRIGVLARTSAMLYKDARHRAGDIGDAMRVDYLVEGSVRLSEGRIRVTAQLIEARGETHRWAHAYDRPRVDDFTIQTDVATEIAQALAQIVAPCEKADHAAPYTGPNRRQSDRRRRVPVPSAWPHVLDRAAGTAAR
jgi:TolB-like protein